MSKARLDEIYILHSNHFPECTYKIDKYFQHYYSVQFMKSGHIVLHYDEKEYELEGSWIWYAYPASF